MKEMHQALCNFTLNQTNSFQITADHLARHPELVLPTEGHVATRPEGTWTVVLLVLLLVLVVLCLFVCLRSVEVFNGLPVKVRLQSERHPG